MSGAQSASPLISVQSTSGGTPPLRGEAGAWSGAYFFAQQGFVQVPLAQAEPASAFMGLQQAQLERARELTARARRVSTFMGVVGCCGLGMAAACLPTAMSGSLAALIYSRKFISAKAEVWRASWAPLASTNRPR